MNLRPRAFYEDRRPGLGDAFVNSIDALFAQIHDNPSLFAFLRMAIGRTRHPCGHGTTSRAALAKDWATVRLGGEERRKVLRTVVGDLHRCYARCKIALSATTVEPH